MDRECSWWNPQHIGLPHEYILEHEQIHFALFEIAARRLNQQVARIQERVEAVSRTQEGAIEALQQRLTAELQAAFEQVKLRSNDFDRPNIVRLSPRAPALVVSPGQRGTQPPARRRAAAVSVVMRKADPALSGEGSPEACPRYRDGAIRDRRCQGGAIH